GGAGYVPEPGDYDGDGKTDPTVYRVSTGQWSVLTSSSNYTATIVVNWGGGGYTPIPGQDFDGDLRADIAVYSQATGTWSVLKSSTSYTTTLSVVGWGTSTDRPISSAIYVGGDDASRAADVDADGKADITVYNTTSGAWSSLTSISSYLSTLNSSW